MTTVLDFSAARANGEDTALSEFGGKVLLVVNTASKCGFTPQYEGLESLQKSFGDRGFSVLAFPCNQFALQEPGTNDEIKEFCDTKYGVTFKIFNKINVNGSKADPLYKFLQKQISGIAGTPQIKWNFTKFLINREGKVVERFSPQVLPQEIEGKIFKYL